MFLLKSYLFPIKDEWKLFSYEIVVPFFHIGYMFTKSSKVI